MDLTPPWQQGSGKDGASDLALVPATETGVAASGGAGRIGSGGAGGFADGLGGAGGAQADLASPSLEDGFDSGSTDAPKAIEVAAAGNEDSAALEITDDAPVDLLAGSGGAGGSSDDAGEDAAIGGQGGGGVMGTGGAKGAGGARGAGGAKGSGGARGTGGARATGGTTGSGGATAKGGTSGAGTGGPGTGGVASTVDATVNACSGYNGVGAGVDAGLAQGLVAYYPCEAASSTNLPDLSGNSPAANATLGSSGTGGSAGYSFAAGHINNALELIKASKGYAALPVGILAGACEMTIATWVYLNSESDWQRIWDFGNDSTVYMFLASSTNGTTKVTRFAITIGGNGNEEGINAGPPLSTGAWIHVAVVLGPAGGALYVDGIQKGANASMTLRPADLGSTQNNYIGRSQFSQDPYLDGNIDDFRIYNRALSADEIKALHDYTGS